MKEVKAHLIGTSPYSQSRYHNSVKQNKEKPDAYELRTWIEKAHWKQVEGSDYLCIPGNQLKKALDSVAGHLGEKVPGRGNKTWKALFLAGVQVHGNFVIEPLYTRSTIGNVCLMQDAQGSSSVKSTRVPRIFPIVEKWSIDATFKIVDDAIPVDVFGRHLKQAGQLVGIGRWRPISGGSNGCFICAPTAEVVDVFTGETETVHL